MPARKAGTHTARTSELMDDQFRNDRTTSMTKLLAIGLKDLTLAFRDRAALILMLAAPFVLTLGLGFASGRFSCGGASGALTAISVVVVNQARGPLGQLLADVFVSDDRAALPEPSTALAPGAARRMVEDDEVAAAVIIPA